MSSSLSYPETNKILLDRKELLDFVSRDDIDDLLKQLDFDWQTGAFNAASETAAMLRENGFLDQLKGCDYVNRMGKLFLSRLLIHLDENAPASFANLNEKYENFRIISSGKNSIVVLANHKLLQTQFVLKLIRPGASADLTSAVQTLSKLGNSNATVLPVDLLSVRATDLLGKPVDIDCLVFPYVAGISFREFLAQHNNHLNSQIVTSFADQVGNSLLELETIGAYHGDLHEENILVDQYATGGIKFYIIDVSFDAMGSMPFEVCRNNDLTNFKQHLWRVLSVQRATLPNMSLRKYIGTKNYGRLMSVLADDTRSFADVRQKLSTTSQFEIYVGEKKKFINAKFERPVSFRLQRYEEITDQEIAVKLFVPFEPLMDKISDFSNVYVSGNRGSGKSTYLASLAFFSNADDSAVNFRQIFGIYFPCRQGEFRPMATRNNWDKNTDRILTTRLMIIKIIRRTLETISAGVISGKLSTPNSLEDIKRIVNLFVSSPGVVLVDSAIQSELENFVSSMVRVEMEELANLPLAVKDQKSAFEISLLMKFFTSIRSAFDELATTQFHLLFDDAGFPYMPKNVQRVLNDLIITSNSMFCTKFSAEKLTFEFQDSDGKVLENGQDYFEHDISQMLIIGTGVGGLDPRVLEEYFRRIIEQRLANFSYKSVNIKDYLGDNQISPDKLVNLLCYGRRDAYYCGWTTVWNIADRTPRNLLEIVSEIFSIANIDRDTEPSVVSNRQQDRAMRTISEKRLESLSQVPGVIKIGGKQFSVGRKLFETTSALGSTFRKYLKAERGKKRKRQHLAIERNELGQLNSDAEAILRKLITFGVLDSGKLGYARDDEAKKPFFVLNRIYCPAFGIGYRRDVHLRLSRGKLEMLLISPQQFMREGTKRLRDSYSPELSNLFNYKEQPE